MSHPLRETIPELTNVYGDCSSLSWIPTRVDRPETVTDAVSRIGDQLELDHRHDWGDPFEILRRTAGTAGNRYSAVLTDCLAAPVFSDPDVREVFATSDTPGVDLDLVVTRREGALTTTWQTRGDSVPETISREVMTAFGRMLRELTDSEAWDRPLRLLGVEPDRDIESSRGRVHGWNDTDRAYDRDVCVHELIERQAARAADRTAVVWDAGEMSRGELERRANRLAHHLIRCGARSDDRVGILLDRSPHTVVSILAILKVGAAYVPLDFTDPVVRTHAALDRADVSLVVTQRKHASIVSDRCPTVLVDAEDIETSEGSNTPPGIGRSAERAAYVIFTSGSTGEPKGVVVQHRPLVNLIEWCARTFDLGPADRGLFVNSLGFDLSVFDILGLLAVGASIRIVSDEERLDANTIAELVMTEPITFWNSAPAYMQFVLPRLESHPRSSTAERPLRLVLLSGDWIPVGMPTDLRSLFPACTPVSLGGATEATVWSNYFVVGSVDPTWRSIPYGRPIQNARYYILDEEMRPCASGEPGELFIGGECLSAGYASSPERTAARFLADPFHERSGMRMYRTGDLARAMSSDDIELLGRVDNQIKLRGFRIDLGDVEAGLRRVGVESPIVVVREDTPGNRALHAFAPYPRRSDRAIDRQLWGPLRERLPEHMVPAAIHILDSLPITSNGKVDRHRLSTASLVALVDEGAGRSLVATAPIDRSGGGSSSDRRTTELAAELEGILGVPTGTVGRTTHFSTLGVSSLHFAQLALALEDRTGVRISPARLFGCSSVGEVEAVVGDALDATVDADSHRSIASDGREDRLGPTRGSGGSEEVAVIGLHCRMPKSANADRLWRNIEMGVDCLETIPASRWDWRRLAEASRDAGTSPPPNRAGFITDIDRFDAEFFAISPREARSMDPRQRLLLEGIWKTLEDAGQRPSGLRGDRVGVYVGATGDEYTSLLRERDPSVDMFTLTGSGRSFLANRLSYYFGWTGESDVIDATCASSLVAVHRATRAVLAGDCSVAIAGGFNLMIDPHPHSVLASAGVLAPDGACKAFDSRADGYARGEGLGLVLLKRLDRAEADKNHIHAVISGSAVNHGGRANSLTAPNMRSQTAVIAKALERSRVAPDEVGYIEAHGTGTALGDPIEFEGLEAVFAGGADDRGSTAIPERISIGSIKATIGHLEAAAGIAGLIKVILMLRHRTIPPLTHFSECNERISLADTPFDFATEARDWPAPRDADGRPSPRAAGVSAFGIGGVNAHVVLREHTADPSPVDDPSRATEPRVFPLSARSADGLSTLARRLREALEAPHLAGRLADVAYTLQTGREAFRHRSAIVAETAGELREGLDAVVEDAPRPHVFSSVTEATGDPITRDPSTAETAPATEDPHELAEAWSKGRRVDWGPLDEQTTGRIVPLPTYPFASTRYWPEALDVGPASTVDDARRDAGDDESSIRLTGDEYFVADHRIDGVRVLPAAASVSLSAGVASRILGEGPLTFRGVAWTRPLRFEDDAAVSLSFELSRQDDEHRFVCRGDDEDEGSAYTSGLVRRLEPPEPSTPIDVSSLVGTGWRECSAEDCYRRFEGIGVGLGSSLRVIRRLWLTEDQAVARLRLPDSVTAGPEYPFEPGILDGGFQTAALHQLLAYETDREPVRRIPFAAKRIDVLAGTPRACYAHVRRSTRGRSRAVPRYDVSILGPTGDTLLEIEGLHALPVPDRALPDEDRAEGDAGAFRIYTDRWRTVSARDTRTGDPPTAFRHVTVGDAKLGESLAAAGGDVLANVLLDPGRSAPGSAVRWPHLLETRDVGPRETIALWYDGSHRSTVSAAEHLRIGFDTVFELLRYLIRRRDVIDGTLALCLVLPRDDSVSPFLAALAGLARVAQRECPRLRVRVLRLHPPKRGGFTGSDLLAAATRGLAPAIAAVEQRIDMETGEHEALRIEAIHLPRTSDGVGGVAIAPGSVQVVTGGAGAIGQLLSRHLADRGARVVAIGRSERPPPLAVAAGEGVHYLRADVEDEAAIAEAMDRVRDRGPIRGVFHCAGRAGGGLLFHRSLSDARRVLAAKVQGTVHLDLATRDDPLSHFVLFSSLASVIGPVGAGDYAYASRFLDEFAGWRNRRVADGRRAGATVALGWPVWRDGGMAPPEAELERLRERGLMSIASETAIRIMERCLVGPGGRYVCGYGEPERFDAFLRADGGPHRRRVGPDTSSGASARVGPRAGRPSQPYETRNV
ncbi:MAG: amino acid adenylation domain-containing protein [Gemmatimonadetes bacterium]|nr:amino acid adenylation domain-containing protein [Gemmatimonadota bacterium]